MTPPNHDDRDACGIALVADVAGRRSHALLQTGLVALQRLAHRGSSGRIGMASDGCGVLANIPWRLLDDGNGAPPAGLRALGAFFVAAGAEAAMMSLVGLLACADGWEPRRWRLVPTHPRELDPRVCPGVPRVVHLECVWRGGPRQQARRALWRLRLRLRHQFKSRALDAVVVSLSAETVVYKALATPDELPRFYDDLSNPLFEAAAVVVHQRFSTNTASRWSLVQPFHLLAHNGEINTVHGNRSAMAARCRSRRVLGLRDCIGLGAVVATDGSDSESLDDAAALLCATGATVPRALSRLLQPAWEQDTRVSPAVRALHQYDALGTEPWEGPAAVVFTDGTVSGAALDASGFRPLRWLQTTDGWVVVASETGVVDVASSAVLEQRRVAPGDLLIVDAATGTVRAGRQARREWARRKPYAAWARQALVQVPTVAVATAVESLVDLRPSHRRFGYDREELDVIVRPMVRGGTEPTGSMGDDTPPAVLSGRPRLISDYFRQRFAQVTNPPIDAARESLVMSLASLLGPRPRLAEGAPRHRMLRLESPILDTAGMAGVFAASAAPGRARGPRTARLDATWPVGDGADGFREAVRTLATLAVELVTSGVSVVVISDSQSGPQRGALPAALALASVVGGLQRRGLRAEASVVVESGEPRDAHHVAVLTSLGAQAVFPYLAFRTAAAMCPDDPVGAQTRLRHALEQGLLKVMAKMGVATFSAYCGAGLMEVLGLGSEVRREYFPDLAGVSGAATLDRLHADVMARHRAADTPSGTELTHVGFHGFRKDGDHHALNPAVVKALHRVAREATDEAYGHFVHLLGERPATAVRDLVRLRARGAVPLDEVESVPSICRRFFASAMSVGALSPEAHGVVARALNGLGGRSNSGEGGEDPARLWPRRGAGASNSVIKQVASGRFGVTPAYLISADELQIKMAQGSKPGEGGQLPAEKVTVEIAHLRHTRPGTALISPPPHHDIYSIEDLAQLIRDLQTFHPTARISVKLVSTSGIGIIAAGVAKAGAHAIQISGHDGGTGASPRGSIKHAGMPWEFGLAEAHRVLTERGLRGLITLQVDGGCKTGLDVVTAALLGADEVGFGTGLLVAAGCVMARQCHANTCPVGIATQRAQLREQFAGTPEQIERYLTMVATHVRRLMAELGVRRFDDMVGHAEWLSPAVADRTPPLALTTLLQPPAQAQVQAVAGGVRRLSGLSLNDRLVEACLPRLGRAPVLWSAPIRNTDLSVGTRLAGVIAERYGDAGSPEPIRVTFTGTAGQSFGAFALPGMHFVLVGQANDGVGKGMHGGLIVVRRAGAGQAGPRRAVLIGNSALYGATGGTLFVAGQAGDRFAVRNSGATAVVEGVGDHGCEYMTGGVVIVLGEVGRNFGAGLTGGLVFVAAPAERVARRVHTLSAVVTPVAPQVLAEVHGLVTRHAAVTGSAVATRLLRRWSRVGRHSCVVRAATEAGLQPGVVTADDGAPWIYANSKS